MIKKYRYYYKNDIDNVNHNDLLEGAHPTSSVES
jgi:hypothetical protein